MPAKSFRDLPEWQAAQAEYIEPAGADDPDEVLGRRVLAASQMRAIEKMHPDPGRR